VLPSLPANPLPAPCRSGTPPAARVSQDAGCHFRIALLDRFIAFVKEHPDACFAACEDVTAQARECEGIVRHIQLKATRGRIVVHRALAEKPSACVVNLEPSVAGKPSRIRFAYRFFGAPAGVALDLEGLQPARKVFNTRGEDGELWKAERPNHVQVPSTRFKTVGEVEELARLLFVRAS
jgi:hypothetical protein